MPELPEVETVKRLLSTFLINRKILNVEVLNPRQIEGDVNNFISLLKNKRILNLSRIGKYLIFHLEEDLIMISHLRMEGKYIYLKEDEPNSKYARVIFHLDNNEKLCYDDSRTFGILKLSNSKDYHNEKEIKKLGPEPFTANAEEIYKNNRKNKKEIKTALLDQTIITGLGNIYVDETLYASKIHPHTPTNLLTLKDWEIILNNASNILNEAIKAGGSTIKSYHPGKDIDGNFQTRLKIYGKKDEECPICHHRFLFTKTNGRGTTFCPGCQHKLGSPINIGITGKIASGKSTALNYFKQKGCLIISSDEIVKSLYQKEEIINKLRKIFPFIKDKIDHQELRVFLTKNEAYLKKLENIIFPLVKKEIIKILKSSKEKLRIIEVPLLFKAHYEDLFDVILIIDISEDNQLNRLISRNKLASTSLLKINQNNQIEENKNKAEFLISNNGSLKEFNNELDKLFNIIQLRLN